MFNNYLKYDLKLNKLIFKNLKFFLFKLRCMMIPVTMIHFLGQPALKNVSMSFKKNPVFHSFATKFTCNFVKTYTFILCLFSSDTLPFVLPFQSFALMDIAFLVFIMFTTLINKFAKLK